MQTIWHHKVYRPQRATAGPIGPQIQAWTLDHREIGSLIGYEMISLR